MTTSDQPGSTPAPEDDQFQPYAVLPLRRAGDVLLLPPRVGEVQVHMDPEEPWAMVARPGERFAARTLDLIAAYAIFVVLSLLLAPLGGTSSDGPALLLAPVVILGALVLYEPFFVANLGATPGKLLLGLRVVRMTDGRMPPSFGRALLRYLSHIVLGWTFIGGVVDIIVMFSGDHHFRSLHDRAGGTVVVYRPKDEIDEDQRRMP